MRYEITDSHRNMPAKKREALKEFFCEVKGIPSKEEAASQVEFCDWYERDFAVSWFEVIAWDAGQAVGYIRVMRDPKDARKWLSSDVHVREAYRRRGIATRMYRRAVKTLLEFEAAETLIASIDRDNTKSIALHEKLGFRNTKRPCKFADFYVHPEDTKFVKPLYRYLPVPNIPQAVERMLPLWMEWKESNGESPNEEKERKALGECLKKAEKKEVIFDGVWRGNRLVGICTDVTGELTEYNQESE